MKFTTLWSNKKRIIAISSQKNWFTAICSSKKVVHNSLEKEKRITAISCQKKWLTAIWSSKEVVYNSLEVENVG